MTENRSRGSQGDAIVVVKKRRFSSQGLKSNVNVTTDVKPASESGVVKQDVSDPDVGPNHNLGHFIKETNKKFVNLDDNVRRPDHPKREKVVATDRVVSRPTPTPTPAPTPGKVFDLSKVEKPEGGKKAEKKKITKIQLADHRKSSKAVDNEYAARSRYIEARKSTAKHYGDEEVSGGKVRSLSALKRQREKDKKRGYDQLQSAETVIKEVVIPSTITVQELAIRMAVRSTDVVKELMKMGMMITGSQPIDADTAEIVVSEFGHKVRRVLDSDIELILDRPEYKDKALMRPTVPVISVMGHVDHGKTSLLDALRETDIVSSESGGITQHIGASKVTAKDGRVITFIDTPGHAAFTQMRMHGAKVTDMVILVVAADDGVKEQTIEAISHAKAAGIPIIIAVNKIDKEGANPKKVLNELLAHGVNAESLGGDCLSVEVSALKKQNLDGLLEAVLLQEEVMALKANYDCPATGAVVESKVDKNKGVMATLLVQHGVLKVGDIVLAGTSYGRVRAMIDERGRHLSEVIPSHAVEILGLNEVPSSGQVFYVVETDKVARDIVEYRIKNNRDIESAKRSKRTLEDIFKDMGDNNTQKTLSVIIKADVRGSSDAISASLDKLTNEKVLVKILHSGVGGINDSDISLARASEAIILGFNVRTVATLKERDLDEVNIKYYSIIYNLVEDIEKSIKGLFGPEMKEKMLGKVEIRKVFNVSKQGKIAGCYVLSGVARRNSNCRIIRDSVVISESKIKVLKRFKDDAKEVTTAMECGISFDNFTEFKEQDQIEVYELIQVDD